MPKVRRNDPCPCGSGKKYKNCHGQLERRQQAEAHTSQHEFGELLDALFAYSTARPEISVELGSAMALFWNGDYGERALDALAVVDRYRFLEWFVFDFPMTRDRKRIIEIFAQERGPALSERKHGMLEAWMKAPLSAFRVEDAVAGRSVLVYDLLLSGEHRVLEESLSSNATSGDIIVGRLLETPSGEHFSLAPMLLPASLEPGLLEFVDRAWSDYQEATPLADKRKYLLESGFLFNHYLVRQAEQSKDVAQVGSHYSDLAKSLKALEKARQEAEEEEARLLEQEQSDEVEESPFKTIAGGRLIVPGEEPTPKPADTEKTFAGGKLLLP